MDRPNLKGVPKSEWKQKWEEFRSEQARKQQENWNNSFANAKPEFVTAEPPPSPPSAEEAPRGTSARKSLTTSGISEPINLFSGTMQKLKLYSPDGDDRDPVPGFKTYWFEDDESMQRIALAKRSGWQHIDQSEVLMHDGLVMGNNDLGTCVSIGVPGSSPPRRMYAMKLPLALVERYAREHEERYHEPIWRMLKSGRVKGVEGQYFPGPRSNMPENKIGVEISKPSKG